MKLKRDKRTSKISIFIALGILVCMALTLSALASEPSGVKGKTCYTHGDINADGSVTSKDAIQLLYYATIEDGYSVEQDCDFEKDGEINAEDAIHLLYSVNGLFADILPGYALDGVIHAYDEPIWSWEDIDKGIVTASYKCACGKKEGVVQAKVETSQKVEATCTDAGSVTYMASATFADVNYGTTKEFVNEPLGHSYAEEASCKERACQNAGCDHVEKATGHHFGDVSITPATCTTAQINTSVCKDCGFERKEQEGVAKGHTLDANSLQEVLVNEDKCEYRQKYTCTSCGQQVEGELINKHSYVATLVTEATCKTEGKKTFECSVCKDTSKPEEIVPIDANAHDWNEGSVDGDITTYTCKDCSTTRKTVNASGEKTASVSQAALQSAKEVEVNSAAIKMDDATLNQLSQSTGQVVISVDETDKDKLNISDAIMEQIGDNTVYDFSIIVDEEKVSKFDGEVTVSLPYVLQEGDDVDAIDVWYIDDNGNVDVVSGVYSNGYVTFTTNHFSYYTVTRLTPKQRCEKYGCSETSREVKATCETDGYTLHVCVRCGETRKDAEVKRLGHDYQSVIVEATCETDGSKTETCTHCKDVRTTEIPRIGHDWQEGEKVAATCSKAGSVTFSCGNDNCGETKTEVLPQLPHSIEETLVPPTCDTKGYTLTKCTACDYEAKEKEVSALGHEYISTWNWVEDEGTIVATLTLTCGRDSAHSVVKDAAIDIRLYSAPTCDKEGSTTYKATVSYNQVLFEDEYVIAEEKYGHTTSDEWKYNSAGHYHVCTTCGAKADVTEHSLDDGMVTKEADCTEEGVKTYTCTCGYKEEESVPALGHNFENDVCTRCQFGINDCTHEELHYVEKEFTEADGICGGFIVYEVCDCGEHKELWGYEFECELHYDSHIGVDENGYRTEEYTATCQNCQMTFREASYWEIGDTCEGTQYSALSLYTKNNQSIFEEEAMYVYEVPHPAVIVSNTVDMTPYGLCGGVVTQAKCLCGEATSFTVDADCDWKYDMENSTSEVSTYNCAECGTQMQNKWEHTEGNDCKTYEEASTAFYRDGELLISFNGKTSREDHDNIYEFTLDGTTCSDGYTVKATCKNCGAVDTYHEKPREGQHWTYREQEISLSSEDTCGGIIYVDSCACGEEKRAWHQGNCMMNPSRREEITEDGFSIYETAECMKCDLRQITQTDYTLVDYECIYEGVATSEYYLGETKLVEGKSELSWHSEDYQHTTYELFGKTCEDGVRITTECTSCGSKHSYNSYGHSSFLKERYELADYGMCGGEISIYGCACGEEGWYQEKQEGACSWNWWYYDEETETDIYKCKNCGMFKHRNDTMEPLDGCAAQYSESIQYVKGYNVVLSLERTTKTYTHDYTYNFVLNVPGGTCSDGFRVDAICKSCGETNWWISSAAPGEHNTYQKESYDLTDYGFCGGEISIYECPCGGATNVNTHIYEECDWMWYAHDEETDTTWWKCSQCKQFYSEKDVELSTEGCYRIQLVTYKFYDADMSELLSIETQERWGNHDYTYSFELDGMSCSDGYIINATCKDCGDNYSRYERTPEGEHYTYRTETYDLTDYGFCGGELGISECPCGEQKGSYANLNGDGEGCNWNWYSHDNVTGATKYQCSKCSGIYSMMHGEETFEGCYAIWDEIYTFYDKDLNEKLSVAMEQRRQNHDYNRTFELDGTSCSDGYTMYVACKNCGYTDSWYSKPQEGDHSRYQTEKYNLADYGLCGGELYLYECPCGEETDYGWNQACEFTNTKYDEETNTHFSECSTCGALYSSSQKSSEIDACHEMNQTEYHLYDKEGAEIASFGSSYINDNHAYINSFELVGKSCEDGYYVNRVCRNCGEAHRDNSLYTGHSMWTIEQVDLAEKGLCGGTATHRSCACGQEEDWRYVENCSWSGYTWVDDNTRRYTCSVCNAIKEMANIYTKIDDCYEQRETVRTYLKDGDVLWSATARGINEYHNYKYTLELMTPGTTCNEGYYAYGTCMRCGDTTTDSGHYHGTFCTEVVDLTEYDMCGGIKTIYQCACGERYSESIEPTCSFNYQGTDENGVQTYICLTCDASRTYQYTRIEDGCYIYTTNTHIYYAPDGTELYQSKDEYTSQNHDYEVTDYVMRGESCEDGCTDYLTCKDCGYETTENYAYHALRTAKEYELSQYGACKDAKIIYRACHCGEIHDIEWSWPSCSTTYTSNMFTDEDGYKHEVKVRACETCGLRFTQDSYSVRNAETCQKTYYVLVTIAVGDTAVDSFTYDYDEESHDYEITTELLEGSTDCEDGYNYTRTCKDCKLSSSSVRYGHSKYEVADSRIDLKELGSVCGGYVIQNSCACGRYNDLQLVDYDCDYDSEYTSPWLGESLEGQETSEGYVSGYRDTFMYVCAVTDPVQCGFTIRGCTYWDRNLEECSIAQYKTWQIGYDRVTGECLKEITIATGNVRTYHDYVDTTTEGTSELGTTKTLSRECSVCGSTHIETITYDEHGHWLREENEWMNTLDNGENKSRHEIEQVTYYMGYQYPVLDYSNRVTAEGIEIWDKDEYIYDWENFDCTCIHKQSDSYGNSSEAKENCHKIGSTWKTIEENSCTQYGKQSHQYYCHICSYIESETISDLRPTQHYWEYYYIDEIYRCGYCGLENINGANGQIVVEDLTSEYGEDGTSYVVGYYNKGDVDFTYYASIICADSEKEEIVLEGVDFKEMTRDNDGIQAISFNQAQANAAAKAAAEAAGYTGEYALRFSFVPVGSDGDFDYAITFGELTE